MTSSAGTGRVTRSNSAAQQQPSQNSSQWYYYLQHDPRGSPDGWYPYEAIINQTVENFYQAHEVQSKRTHNPFKKARQLLPVTTGSGFQYELDFQHMTQRNITSSKQRPIARTTDGNPPGGQHAQPLPQWYYYLQHDPRGSPDGWYAYEAIFNQTVETFYQAHEVQSKQPHNPSQKARQLLPMAPGSRFQYELDFESMTQCNTTTSKQRPIARTTDGNSPGGQIPQQPVAASAYVGGHQAQQQRFYNPSVPPPVAALPAHGVIPHTPSQSAVSKKRGVYATYRSTSSGGEELTYSAPEVLHEVHMDESKIFRDVDPPSGKPPAKANAEATDDDDEKKQSDSKTSSSYANASHDDDCVICLDSLWGAGDDAQRVVAIKSCTHRFHYDCIKEALTKLGGKCSLCSKSIEQEEGTSQTSKGKMPSGTMSVSTMPLRHCAGYGHMGTIHINYQISGGIQKAYHQNPGTHHAGAGRTAYVPDTQEGQDLSARLQYAFCHGLTFMVGTSLTTSRPNQVTWASIHHKTSMHGGTYGYPDDTYFDRANDELNELGVPTPVECRQWLQSIGE